MESDFSISLYLDTRRAKANGKYPVKLRVYSPVMVKTKLFPTVFEMTEKEFQSIYDTVKPRNEYKEKRLQMQAVEHTANETAKSLKPFSFEQFEKRLYRTRGEGVNILYQYDQRILKLRENKQFGTASNYEMSKRSLIEFVEYRSGKKITRLQFAEVDEDWLNNYERFMLETSQRSRTTVGMYLRALRAVYNLAIRQGEIDQSSYPFGDNKYQIPAAVKVKKSFSKEILRLLFDAIPQTPEQQRAKDFWFFSYFCNGMNIKDIALLRWENFTGTTLDFYRAKTINTSKQNLKPVIVRLSPFALDVINKYGVPSENRKDKIFPILDPKQSEYKQFTAIKNFTRFINQNFKKYAKANGINEDVSTYWARHTFVTTTMTNGQSIQVVSNALSHSSVKVTQDYFAGFPEEIQLQLMNAAMDF